jgi:hypothetical protein
MNDTPIKDAVDEVTALLNKHGLELANETFTAAWIRDPECGHEWAPILNEGGEIPKSALRCPYCKRVPPRLCYSDWTTPRPRSSRALLCLHPPRHATAQCH